MEHLLSGFPLEKQMQGREKKDREECMVGDKNGGASTGHWDGRTLRVCPLV